MLFYIGSNPNLPNLTFVGKKLYLDDDDWSYIVIDENPIWYTNNLNIEDIKTLLLESKLDKNYILITRVGNLHHVYHSQDHKIYYNNGNLTNIPHM